MPTLPAYDRALLVRVSYLTRIESMVNVGCKFAPDDLDPSTWDQLIAVALERQFVEELLRKRREKKGETNTQQQAARRQAGVPAPGGTIFKPTKPFKGPTR